jgi:type I restriction enzyme S subunit
MPPDRDREAIISVIQALDDKIAVNDRILKTVNELSSVLLDDAMLGDDEISEVRLVDVAVVNQQKVTPLPGKEIRYIDISSVSHGSVEWPPLVPWEDAPSRARRGVSVGDTIWSTVRPGRKSFALILDNDPELVVSTGFAVLTPQKVGPAFLHEVAKRDKFVQYLESVAEGSAYPAVRADRFEQAVIPLLSTLYLNRFETQAIELRRRAHSAQRESRCLVQLRDTLLPRLMSGEIRVKDAEKVVEGAT